jgi:hypothetical protein
MNNERVKYRFELLLQPKEFELGVKFLQSLDINIEGAGYKELITFTRDTERPVSELKDIIIKGYRSIGITVLKIEGGKIE